MTEFENFLTTLHHELTPVSDGAVASYIPELARADPDHFGICAVLADGRVFEAGDTRARFTLQSVSKPFAYGLALDCHGPEKVLERVGVEPTGEAFNAIVLEQKTGRPLNPMVNAGAIAVADMIPGADATDRLHRLLDSFQRTTGRDDLSVDTPTFLSERLSGHRNRAVAHLMRAYSDAVPDPEPPLKWALAEGEKPFSRLEESLDLYFQQCAILVDCRDLAVMAATLANGGENPLTGERAVSSRHIKRILSVMYTCGMYDSAGDWAYRVGLPAKSGVSGGLLAVVPGQLGIAVYSPRVDAHGNSVRGIRVCEAFSQHYGLHLFDNRRTIAAPLLDAAT
jgi:glutaminase